MQIIVKILKTVELYTLNEWIMWISPQESCFGGFSYWSSGLDSAFPIQGGLVSIPGQGTRSYMLQLRAPTLQLKRSCRLQRRLKIPHAAIKTWHRQIILFLKVVFKKNEGEIRTTSNIEDLNVFISSRAAPLEMLKKCPSWKKKMIPDRNMDLLKKKKKNEEEHQKW